VTTYWKDVLERFLATLVEAFSGSFVTVVVMDSLGVISLTNAKVAALVGISSAVIAGLSFIKSVAARWKGDPNSASLVDLPCDE